MSEWELPASVETTTIERVGGGSFLWDSGVYKANIEMVYLDQAKSGAVSFNILLKNEEGKELKEAMYIKSGDKKGNKTYYEKDGKQFPLPGYSTANSLCISAVGKPLHEVLGAVEKKMVNIYNSELKKEVPTERPVPMELVGKTITVAVHNIVEDKNIKNDAGEYVPSGETRGKNECKFFGNAEGLSTEEKQKGEEPKIFKAWAEKNDGIVIDKTSGAKQNKAEVAPAPSASSMFG